MAQGRSGLLPRGRSSLPADDVRAAQRERLIRAMVSAVAERGYAEVTVADVVAAARVSRTSFYAQFADKEACFFAAYRAIAGEVMRQVATAVNFEASWEAQIEAAVRTYVTVLDSRPKLTRAFFLEIHAAGARAIALRREVLTEFAELTRGFVAQARKRQPELVPLTAAMATAMVGGINELMLLKAERHMKSVDLAETAVALCKALVAPARARGA